MLLHALGQEVPHKLYVETETLDDAAGGALRIGQVIHVADKAHKKIVLGQGGAMIKKVSIAAREKMTDRLQRKIHLFLYVRHTKLGREVRLLSHGRIAAFMMSVRTEAVVLSRKLYGENRYLTALLTEDHGLCA